MYRKYNEYKDYKQRQAGHRYEQYVAQTLRQQGWTVIDNGSNGVEDHGIDLIATKDGVSRYIQCKGWNRHKVIHEDVVSHLFGSVAAIEGVDNLQGVEKYIYSPAQLDDYSQAEAERLGIHIEHLALPTWHRRARQYFHGQSYTSHQQ
jgi:hypothetical protein